MFKVIIAFSRSSSLLADLVHKPNICSNLSSAKNTLEFWVCELSQPMHRGAFCQFPFRWIYYYGSNKSTGKETGKMHLDLCAMIDFW